MVKPTGRPTKLTPERQRLIVKLLEKGNLISTVCDAVGISEAAFCEWIEKGEGQELRPGRGRTGDQIYVEFAEATKRARARAETELLNRIEKAGLPEQSLIERRTITRTPRDGPQVTEVIERWRALDWQASAWILERTHYEKYGEHTSADIQHKGVIFLDRIRKARERQVDKAIKGEFKEIGTPEALPGPSSAPGEAVVPVVVATPRPIFELVNRVREKAQKAGKIGDAQSYDNIGTCEDDKVHVQDASQNGQFTTHHEDQGNKKRQSKEGVKVRRPHGRIKQSGRITGNQGRKPAPVTNSEGG